MGYYKERQKVVNIVVAHNNPWKPIKT